MYYKALISAALWLLVVSCKKEHRPTPRTKHITATIVSPTAGTVTINSEAGDTYISCGYTYWGIPIPTLMEGINEYYLAAIRLSVSDTCITEPGTYNFICQYIKDYTAGGPELTFENDSVSDPGKITFDMVRVDDNNGVREVFVQGRFHATCISGPDSVLVTGTFDGYFN